MILKSWGGRRLKTSNIYDFVEQTELLCFHLYNGDIRIGL